MDCLLFYVVLALREHSFPLHIWQGAWLETLDGVKDDLHTVIAKQESDTSDNERWFKWYYQRYPEEDPEVQTPGTFREGPEKLKLRTTFLNSLRSTLHFVAPGTRACPSAPTLGAHALSGSDSRGFLLLLLCAERNFAPGKVGGGALCQEEAQRCSGDAGSFVTQQAQKEAAKVSCALINMFFSQQPRLLS